MTKEEFLGSPAGRTVEAMLSDAVVRADMMVDPSRRSPVRALNPVLQRHGIVLSDVERQHVGRRVSDWMRRVGWKARPGPRDQFAGQGPLTSGAYYDPAAPIAASPAERVAQARALSAALPGPLGTVDDLLAERRAEAAREAAGP